MNKITRNIIGTSLAMMTMAATALDANQFINYMLNPNSAAGVPGMGPNGAPADWQNSAQAMRDDLPNLCANPLNVPTNQIVVVFGANDHEYSRIENHAPGVKINHKVDFQTGIRLQLSQNCKIQYYNVYCKKVCMHSFRSECPPYEYFAVLMPAGTGTVPRCTPQP